MNLRGPDIYRVGDLERQSIAAGTTGANVTWVWPKSVLVTDILFAPRGLPPVGHEAAWNSFGLQIIDERERAMFSDGKRPHFMTAWLLHVAPMGGRRRRWHRVSWYPLRKPVRAGDKWVFSANLLAGAPEPQIPMVLLRFEDAK